MTVLGVLLAFVAGTLLGVTAASLAVVLFAGMLAGAVRVMRDESTTAAATALVVLLTGYREQGDVLVARLLDTAIGIAVGLVVTLVVWPLRDRSAARQVDAIDDGIGALLAEIAGDLRDAGHEVDSDAWVERTRDLDHDIDKAWGVVRLAHESGRLNLRHAAARIHASDRFAELLTPLEQAVAETCSMARTIGRAGLSASDPRFREAWLGLLSRAASPSAAATASSAFEPTSRGRATAHTRRPPNRSTARYSSTCATLSRRWKPWPTPSRCAPPPGGIQGCRRDRRPARPARAVPRRAPINSDASPIAPSEPTPAPRRRLPHPLPTAEPQPRACGSASARAA